MKTYTPYILAILCFVFCYCCFSCEDKKIVAVVKEKFITWDKYGDPEYYVIYSCNDGRLRQEEVYLSEYSRPIGSTKIILEPNFYWNPIWK